MTNITGKRLELLMGDADVAFELFFSKIRLIAACVGAVVRFYFPINVDAADVFVLSDS